MTINPDDFYGYEDAPISADEPACECGSTYVKFINFVPDPKDPTRMLELFECKICGKHFTHELSDIPF